MNEIYVMVFKNSHYHEFAFRRIAVWATILQVNMLVRSLPEFSVLRTNDFELSVYSLVIGF